MAVKTITIDLEAYEALSRQKKKGDSFSHIIKEHFGRRRTGRGLQAILGNLRVAKDTIDHLERIVRARGKGLARAPKLRTTSTLLS
jgi:predicted CopG family antitoxin